jgi:hypothetical protein
MDSSLETRVNELEEKLAQAAARPKKRHGLKRQLAIMACLVLFAISGLGAFLYIRTKNQAAIRLPANLVSGAGFTVYAPATMPESFNLDERSASYQSGILYYKLISGRKEILIIQQQKPPHDLGLTTSADLKPFDTPLGKAYSGKNGATPLAILAAKATLVNVTGSADVPADIINTVVSNLKAVN